MRGWRGGKKRYLNGSEEDSVKCKCNNSKREKWRDKIASNSRVSRACDSLDF